MQPKHLQPWVEFINYSGENFDGYYIAAMRLFRCTPTERANFEYAKELLGDCGASPGQVLFPVFTDDQFLGRYYILIHEHCERGLRMADMLAERVRRRGSINPEYEAQIAATSILKSWEHCDLLTKVLLCKEAGISVFTARRKEFPAESKGAFAISTSLASTK